MRRATALVFLAALFYFLLFHRYGFFLQDEGVNAYQALRVLQGQVPYRDFQTAYPPAGYYLHAALFQLFGPGLPLLRVAASFACATTAALLFLAAVEVLPSPWAFLPSLLYVVLEDQESQGFVVHTIAYPARYVTALWALSLWLTLVHARAPRRRLVVGLGLVTAGIVSLKHTAGIYNAWAVGTCLILTGLLRKETAAPSRTAILATVPVAFLLAVLVALPLLFGGFTALSAPVLVAVWVPVTLAVLLLVRDVSPRGGDSAARRATLAGIGADLAWFGAAALVPTAIWVAYFAVAAGAGNLVQRLLLDGRLVARSYAVGFPRPAPLTGLVAVVVAVALGARMVVGRGVLDRERAARALVVAVAGLTVVALVASVALVRQTLRMGDLELAVMHVGRAVDNVGFYLTPLIAYAFLPALAARRRNEADHLVLLCWLHAVFQLLLVYPRFDVAHLYEGTVLLLIPGVGLLHRTLGFFRAGSGRRWLPAAVACALAIVVGLKLAPRVHAQLGWEDGLIVQRRMPLDGPRGGLYETGPQAAWLSALNRTVGLVTELTPPGAPVFAFPALSALYFLSDRTNPTAYDYFYQGFGEGADELAIVTELETRQVPIVVTLADESYDQRDRSYFPILKDYLRRHFRQAEAFAPFRVLERVLP